MTSVWASGLRGQGARLGCQVRVKGARSGCGVRVLGQGAGSGFPCFNLDSGTGVPGQCYYKLTNNNMIFYF